MPGLQTRPGGRTRPRRELGSGEVLVDSQSGPLPVRYTAMYETRDGLTLYAHDTELHPFPECGPCPLLKAKTACRDCEWYVQSAGSAVRGGGEAGGLPGGLHDQRVGGQTADGAVVDSTA
jgi:hypothetical protein